MRLHAFIVVIFLLHTEVFAQDLFNFELKREELFNYFEFIKKYTFKTDYLSIVQIAEDIESSEPPVIITEFLTYHNAGK